jgi:uncharacterized protein (TIGR03437 family)
MTRAGISSLPLFLAFCLPSAGLAQTTYTIATVAGGQAYGPQGIGDNGPAVNCFLNGPGGVAVDASGNIYIADTGNQLIRKVGTNGIITTVAGSNGSAGFSGDGGPAKSAKLNYPSGVAVDSAGNIYIADTSNNFIRKVTASTGIITTIAGNSTILANGVGDGGRATSANLSRPKDVALDASGNLYIADLGNYRVRKVDTSGNITTVAGNGFNASTFGSFGDGGAATGASVSPYNLALDNAGNIYIADSQDAIIRKVTVSTGIITTVAGIGGQASFFGDGGPAVSAELNNPQGIAVDTSGNLWIADTNNSVIREVTTNGNVNTVAGTQGTPGSTGDGGPGLSATLSNPSTLARTSAGLIYIVDTSTDTSTTKYLDDRIRLLTPSSGAPAISSGGVVPIFSSATTIQPGSWISIYGTSFAAATTTWNGDFPQSLGGVSVMIDSKPAYLWFVSAAQINAQAPDDTATGSVPVTVTTAGGTATSSVTLGAYGPSFSLLNSRYPAAIVLTPGSGGNSGGGYDIIGPVGAFSYPTRPVQAGETVILYGVGFGPTNPAVPSGQIVSSPSPSVKLPTVTIGGVAANVTYGGIVEAGLFQFNVVVPAAGSGDQLLQAMVGGLSTPANVYLTLQ